MRGALLHFAMSSEDEVDDLAFAASQSLVSRRHPASFYSRETLQSAADAVVESLKRHSGAKIEESKQYIKQLAIDAEKEGMQDVVKSASEMYKKLMELSVAQRREAQALQAFVRKIPSVKEDELINLRVSKRRKQSPGQPLFDAMKKIREQVIASTSNSSQVDEGMKEFRRDLWYSNHPNETFPDDEGEEIAVVSHARSINLNCPITNAPLVEPVRNSKCKHTYSKPAILALIQQRSRNGALSCPVAGCSSIISKDSLERDFEAEFNLRQASHHGLEDEREDSNILDFTQSCR